MSHPTREFLIARLAYIRQDLDEILSKLTPEMVAWAPAPKMRTVGGQLAEIAYVEWAAIISFLEDRDVTDEEELATFGDPNSLDNLKNMLANVREATLITLNEITDEQLNEVISFKKPWFGMAGMSKAPLAELFRSFAIHESYHIGQLVSYLWALGEDPYSW